MAMATHDDWQSGKTLAESASYMFDKEIATDVTFKFPNSDRSFKAHRVILIARRHVFFTMFNSGLDKPGEAIEIADIEPAVFKQFLRYLYLDNIKLITTKALHLTYCAEKYEVKALKAQCMGFLLEQVNEMTCAEILDHALFYNEESLTQACLQFLTSCKSLEIKGLDEYHIIRDTLEVVMDYGEIPVSEVDIFKFCQTWAEQECKKKEVPVNMTNKRKMLGPLVKKIPFCSMKQEEFVAEVSGRHFLNGQEELQIFRYLCAADKANPPFPCMTLREAKDVANPRFPCMKPKEAKDVQVSVKLPNVCNWVGKSQSYNFSIRCSQSFTLIGLIFTHRGKFSINFGFDTECMEVQQRCQAVYLKEAVHCAAGKTLQFHNPLYHSPCNIKTDFPFSSEVKADDSGLYKKLDFVITKLNDVSGQPPFDTVIVRLQY